MKKIASFSVLTAVALSAQILPSNVLETTSLAQENGGSKSAIEAYSDGGGSIVIGNNSDAVKPIDNSPMNELVFKYGQEAKNNGASIVDQVKTIDINSPAVDKALADKIVREYQATANTTYSCLSGTLSGVSCIVPATTTRLATVTNKISVAPIATPKLNFADGKKYCEDQGYRMPKWADANWVGNSMYCPASSGYTWQNELYSSTMAYASNGAIGSAYNMTTVFCVKCISDKSYSCNTGETLVGTMCSKTTTTTVPATANTTYSCPNGGTLNGTTCTK